MIFSSLDVFIIVKLDQDICRACADQKFILNNISDVITDILIFVFMFLLFINLIIFKARISS
ncbi:hypothetical protein HOG27_02145 [bacterium]|nr:hypothetical protein [bacterium]MBT6778663.1 hypothetical protein [bacterium]